MNNLVRYLLLGCFAIATSVIVVSHVYDIPKFTKDEYFLLVIFWPFVVTIEVICLTYHVASVTLSWTVNTMVKIIQGTLLHKN